MLSVFQTLMPKMSKRWYLRILYLSLIMQLFFVWSFGFFLTVKVYVRVITEKIH